MVTRAFARDDVRRFNRELGQAQSTIRGTILPALGLGLAFNFLSGNMGGATASGVAMGRATYGAQTAMAQLADTLAQFLLPGIEFASEGAEELLDWFNDLDEGTQQWILGLTLGGAAALKFHGTIASLTRLLLSPVGAGTVGALLAGGLTFNTVRDLQEGGVDRALDPVASRNAQATRAVQDFITDALGLPNVRRGFGSGPDANILSAQDWANAWRGIFNQPIDRNNALRDFGFSGRDDDRAGFNVLNAADYNRVYERVGITPTANPAEQNAPVRDLPRVTGDTVQTVTNYFTITAHDTETLIARLQDSIDTGLLRLD